MSIAAPVTNISKGSLHDGPGVRTVVYLKGCSLKCKWCHNPETISSKKEILYTEAKCIKCGRCVEVCPQQHKVENNRMIFVRENCSLCGKCAEVCPSLALSLCGEEKTSEEIFEEIKKDISYYKISGGGITFSGGECLLYPDFVVEVFKMCKNECISTAIESAFSVPFENIKKVLPYTDLIFADLKIPDSAKHKAYTGRDNKLIIENLKKASELHDNIILRIPLIPGVNDSESDLSGFAKIINSFSKGIKEVELLKYNNLAESKYISCGRKYTEFAKDYQTEEEMKKTCDYLAKATNKNCFFV